jgi:hypothetical protein
MKEPALTEGERAGDATLPTQVPEGSGPEEGRMAATGRRRWRTMLAVLLIVLGSVLAPLAGVAVWARNQVTNTDRYVATVAPLASDPAIQNAIADQITAKIFSYLDVQGLTTQAVDALASRGLPPRLADQLQGLATPIANGVQSFTRTEVGKLVQTQAFADVWVQANRLAHQALVKALTGEGGGAVTVQGATPSASTWRRSSGPSSSSWSPAGSPWPPVSRRSTRRSCCSTSRTSPARKPRSTCSTPWGTGCRSSRWSCWGSASTSPRTTAAP